MPDLDALLHPAVAIYISTLVAIQVALIWRRGRKARLVAEERQRAGLDATILADHAETLEALRGRALSDALVLLIGVLGLPVALVWLSPQLGLADAEESLALAFLGLIVWILVSTTGLATAFFGGLAFRAFVGVRRPFQVGDRVTLMGHIGKVVEVGPFHIRLQTPDDDLVSLPSAKLWSEPLISSNAGDRASLSVITFHLAPFVRAKQREVAENAIWTAIQCSVYWDFEKPAQIYVQQCHDEILLVVKAYVTSTYNAPLFESDVTKAFLDSADAEDIPLASTEWRRPVSIAENGGDRNGGAIGVRSVD